MKKTLRNFMCNNYEEWGKLHSRFLMLNFLIFFIKIHALNFKSANFSEFLLCFSFKILRFMSSTIKIDLWAWSHTNKQFGLSFSWILCFNILTIEG